MQRRGKHAIAFPKGGSGVPLGASGLDGKSVAEVVHIGRQKADADAAALQRVNQWRVEALSVREHSGHELGGMVALGIGSLVGFDGIGRAVSVFMLWRMSKKTLSSAV